MGTSYPGAIDSFTPPTSTDTMDGLTGGVEGDVIVSNLIAAIEALETLCGITGALSFVLTAGGSTITVPSGAPGVTIQFAVGSNGTGLIFYDHLGNPIGGVGSTGGWKTFGDRTQAGPGVSGPFISLDGTTSPPSILMPSTTYGAGNRIWYWAGTPAAGWVAGTTQVNDLWYNSATGQWLTCTVSGAGTAAGTWVNGNGVNQIGAQVAYSPVSANFTNTSAAGGSFQQADTTSGTAPSITLPNDGNLYKVEFLATAWKCSVADVAAIGIGTSPTNVLVAQNAASLPTTNQFVPPLIIPKITGSGQVLKMYTEAATTGHTVSVLAAAGPGLTTPASLAAYRVG